MPTLPPTPTLTLSAFTATNTGLEDALCSIPRIPTVYVDELAFQFDNPAGLDLRGQVFVAPEARRCSRMSVSATLRRVCRR